MDMLTLDFVAVEPDWLDASPTFPPAHQFHTTYPEVYEQLRRLALDLVDRGWIHLGIGMLWETLRYTSMLGADPSENVGGGYTARLNNSHRAFYARLLMEREPRLVGVFETRTKI